MSRLLHKLRDRIQVRRTIDDSNDIGGYDRSYETVLTVWGNYKSLATERALPAEFIRGVNVGAPSHIVTIRRVAVESLGKEYSTGFSDGFNTFSDLNIMKSEYFLFIQRGSTTRGQLFRISGYEDVDSRREYLRLKVIEIEEQGTGYQA